MSYPCAGECAACTMVVQDTEHIKAGAGRREETMNYPLTENVPCTSAKAYRVEDIARILDISRSSAYNLVRAGHFKTIRIGTAIRISKKSFDEWLERQDV